MTPYPYMIKSYFTYIYYHLTIMVTIFQFLCGLRKVFKFYGYTWTICSIINLWKTKTTTGVNTEQNVQLNAVWHSVFIHLTVHYSFGKVPVLDNHSVIALFQYVKCTAIQSLCRPNKSVQSSPFYSVYFYHDSWKGHHRSCARGQF